MGKLICEKVINGETTLLNATTAAGVVATLVKTTPGVGNPFWYWPSIPAGKVVACDFTDAPIATGDTATNTSLIAAITKTPQEVLIYDPPLA
jgi:hypothetical protein